MNECYYCRSTEVVKDLPLIARETNTSPVLVGPYYSVGTKKFLGMVQNHCKHEPMYVDLCKKCGSLRLHVKNTDRDWQHEVPSAGKVVWQP